MNRGGRIQSKSTIGPLIRAIGNAWILGLVLSILPLIATSPVTNKFFDAESTPWFLGRLIPSLVVFAVVTVGVARRAFETRLASLVPRSRFWGLLAIAVLVGLTVVYTGVAITSFPLLGY